MARKKAKGSLKRFMVTVHEEFSGAYSVDAKDEAEARQIVEEGIPDEYCPSQFGEGYRRKIYVDPD